ncbi:protein CHUP1, chloroplastic isoform X2 [Amaranthus tricolor]|uniref:protein CHUP1, chloroplastic isoform X2 n=1 Tax=Amaranthus tricolor TaxID=29722 RepID=UPI0025897CE4|nr:protein CHUP1, chloroplastic isoform X2 [Amaranthus tricolor]
MMMIKEKRNMKPFLMKFGVALALSFAGFIYSRIRTRRFKPSLPSPKSSVSDSDRKVYCDGRSGVKDDLQPEIDSIDASDKPCIRVRVDNSSLNASPKDFDNFSIKQDSTKPLKRVERNDYEQEIDSLKKRIKFLVERERRLEVQLLEYYGLKEQETAMMELQNRLKINSMEAKIFSMKIDTLQSDNKRLEAQVADYSKVVNELEAAKEKIKKLQWKLRYNAEQNKEKILDLTQRVAKLHEQERGASTNRADDLSEIHKVVELEAEVEGLRKYNECLEQENADLAQRLDSTQMLANTLFEDPEREELSKAMVQQRKENQNLREEIERLQTDRCADAEELVYLRWINACLRYELRNYQPPPGKTVARDLSKCLSPTSEKKAKQLILEYANTEHGVDGEPLCLMDLEFDHWPSSQPSYLTDSTDHDESPGRPSSTNKSHSKKVKFFSTLRKLVRGISSHHTHHSNYHNRSGQTSPMYRSLSVDNIVGLDGSRSNPQSPKFALSSQNSNNSSLDHQPLASLAEEDENGSRRSNSRSTMGGVVHVLGRGSLGFASSSPLDYTPERVSSDYGQKSELAKYAEVLRDNRSLQKHKKSASFQVG